MAQLAQLFSHALQNARQPLTSCDVSNLTRTWVRYASKKSSTSTRNRPTHARPKHRGWKVQDGHYVTAGRILALQLTTRFHPGLNVGFGRNGTLFALEAGKVAITCEKIDPNWEHSWIIKNYSERKNNPIIYKKHFNVIPEPQHNRFKLIDKL